MKHFFFVTLLVALSAARVIDNVQGLPEQGLQGYFDTLKEIYYKLKELGHETVCGQTVSELIDLLGLPDFLDGIVATARGWICDALSAPLQVRDVAEPAALQGYFDTLRQIILKLKELGHETVCGQTVSELIDLLGLPDFLDGIVATARGFVCSALSARLQVRDVAEPAALQGYFDTLRQIILKLKELGHETVCGQTVSELIDLLGLPDFLDGIVATARGFVCSALSARLQVRDVAEPAALQGYFDTLRQIILKLKELGHETVCGQTVSELIDLLGLPDFLDGMVVTARGYICDALGSEVEDLPLSYEVEGFFDTLEEIIEKLFKLGEEVYCSKTVDELLELLYLPETFRNIIHSLRSWPFCPT
ncbi:hypothetical protein ACHWQZ_G007566 [Mnemiopsis leidyi]